jgi:hypothetical protein
MPLPLLLAIPAAVITALIVFIKAHALHITFSAASAAVMEFIKTRDYDLAAEAAIRAGASAATGDGVRDFFRLKF